ncbi:MAG: DUF4625 domain-containing protein [Proteiniphilum sp.]|jgi:hypothetical protein|nr:DUF4625 domain-containing protein [Proteiniphilum sp.]
MKRKLFLGAMLFLSANVLFFSSCEDDNDKPLAPTVEITELGSGHDNPNDKTAYIGAEAHIGAEITADGLIRDITVEVHQEDGDFKFSEIYSKYVGVKNATFHEHLDIPSDAPEGEYHLHLVVRDQEGQTAMAESELTIIEGSGEHDDDDHDDH